MAAARMYSRYVLRRFSSGGKVLSEEEKAAARMYSRYVPRRFSSGGKVLSEEEKAAENVYIKKVEKEKLEKLARKGVKPGEQPPTATGTSPVDATSTGTSGRSRADTANALASVFAIVWYISGGYKAFEVQEEVQK